MQSIVSFEVFGVLVTARITESDQVQMSNLFMPRLFSLEETTYSTWGDFLPPILNIYYLSRNPRISSPLLTGCIMYPTQKSPGRANALQKYLLLHSRRGALKKQLNHIITSLPPENFPQSRLSVQSRYTSHSSLSRSEDNYPALAPPFSLLYIMRRNCPGGFVTRRIGRGSVVSGERLGRAWWAMSNIRLNKNGGELVSTLRPPQHPLESSVQGSVVLCT